MRHHVSNIFLLQLIQVITESMKSLQSDFDLRNKRIVNKAVANLSCISNHQCMCERNSKSSTTTFLIEMYLMYYLVFYIV